MSVPESSHPPVSQEVARWGGGLLMILAGVGHVSFAREGFKAQVPNWVPKVVPLSEDDVVLVSGGLEIAMGLGMVALPRERRRIAALTTAFLVSVFPGNIAQYRNHADGVGLDTDRKRLVRLLTEPLMWATALHSGGLLSRRGPTR